MTGLIERIVCMDPAGALSVIKRDQAQARSRDEHIGSTPLHFAAHRGLADVVDALLAAGADVHARERASDTTALHWAAEGGHERIIRALVRAGADVDAVDGWFGLTPLGWATVVTWAPRFHADKPAAARALVELGALPDIFTAVGSGAIEELRALVGCDGAQLKRRLGFAGEERTALHVAAASGKVDVVQALIELALEGDADGMPTAGEMVNAASAFGERPLAVARDDVHAVLRKHGAVDDRATIARGKRAAAQLEPELRDRLAFATARDGRLDEAYVLLDIGVDRRRTQRILVDEVPVEGTAAQLAKACGHDEVAKLFAAG